MKNLEVARYFDVMADVLELKDDNPFRVRAYRRAAENLRSLSEDVATLAQEDRLTEIPGIGEDLAGKIAEYLRKGRVKEIEAARRGVPDSVLAMMSVPGIGPKTARALYEEEGISSLDQLEKLARAGRLRGRHGIQARSEQNILKGIALLRAGQERMPLGQALPLGRELVRALQAVSDVNEVALAGSARRMKETVGDLDILVASGRTGRVIKAFAGLPQAAEVLEQGDTKAAIRHREGIQVDLRVVEPESFGAALVYFTGSKQHNLRIREMGIKRGLKISEYGVFRGDTGKRIAGATEEQVYAAVGLPWIPPELREDRGEVEAGLAGRLPVLVTLEDIRGDLHCHTKASDGRYSIEEVVEAAAARGYEYVLISDHSVSARVAGGLRVEELDAHVAKIRAVARKHPNITVLAGCECDILADGRLDYPDAVLGRLDVVVAAIHSRFRQPRRELTRRICAALANPHVSIFAHPTGRILGERAAYDVDLDHVLKTAKQLGKAIEVNAYPSRLDLNDAGARRAHDLGVLLSIATDTHMLDHLPFMELGVGTARRGWIAKQEVVNTWPISRLMRWVRGQRKASGPAQRKRR